MDVLFFSVVSYNHTEQQYVCSFLLALGYRIDASNLAQFVALIMKTDVEDGFSLFGSQCEYPDSHLDIN